MPSIFFRSEPVPTGDRCSTVGDGITRIVAHNPSKMTYHGTNTYLVDTSEGIYIIDPGPADDNDHIAVIVDKVGNAAAGILITHHHSDHFGAARELSEKIMAPIHVSSAFPDQNFRPGGLLEEKQVIGGLTVLHTPGHASDHLCFARSDGLVFTGDHIMSWNSSIVSPPDGNMIDYCSQLQRMIDREDVAYLPGHGPVIANPKRYVELLLTNRLKRETDILRHLSRKPDSVPNIAAEIYKKSDPNIAKAAERNVAAHLEKLFSEGRVAKSGSNWRAIP